MNSKWINEKEELERLINVEKVSYEEIGRRYGCSGNNIKKVAKLIGIVLPQRRKINPLETFNKGKGAKKETPKNKIIERNKENHYCLNCGNILNNYAKKFCSLKCKGEFQHKQLYQLILNGDASIMRANYSPRKFRDDIISEQQGVCAICGCKPEHNGKPLVFIVDHIDGNAANNRRDNLRCVCPNCDSQLDTYKSKNKNGARSYYRYHKYDKETE